MLRRAPSRKPDFRQMMFLETRKAKRGPGSLIRSPTLCCPKGLVEAPGSAGCRYALVYTFWCPLRKAGKGEGGDKSEQPHQPVDRRYSYSGVNHHPLAAAMSRPGQEKVGQPQ